MVFHITNVQNVIIFLLRHSLVSPDFVQDVERNIETKLQQMYQKRF